MKYKILKLFACLVIVVGTFFYYQQFVAANSQSQYLDNIDRNQNGSMFESYLFWRRSKVARSQPVYAQAEYQRPKKKIVVYLDEQKLRYFEGYNMVGEILVATGLKGLETPKGTFEVLKKLPLHNYRGEDYYYPNIKWNLMFVKNRPGQNLYIHGAPWNRRLGRPGSHGCVNVSYKDMEPLYDWADVGTEVVVQ